MQQRALAKENRVRFHGVLATSAVLSLPVDSVLVNPAPRHRGASNRPVAWKRAIRPYGRFGRVGSHENGPIGEHHEKALLVHQPCLAPKRSNLSEFSPQLIKAPLSWLGGSMICILGVPSGSPVLVGPEPAKEGRE